MKVTYSRRALDDIAAIADYIRPLNPASAAKVGAAIRVTIRWIARHPL